MSVYKVLEAQKKLSFPQVKRVGNPSLKPSERFRTSRNDRQTAKLQYSLSVIPRLDRGIHCFQLVLDPRVKPEDDKGHI